MEEWEKHDPLPRYTRQLVDMGIIDEAYVQKLEESVAAEIEDAVKKAGELPRFTSYENHEKRAIAEL